MTHEEQGIPRPHDRASRETGREERLDPRDDRGVAAADRSHLDDLAVDELDAAVLVEDAGLAHAVILVEREPAPPDVDCHGLLGLDHVARVPVSVNAVNPIHSSRLDSIAGERRP